jgi:hypothetical protein
MISKVNAEKNPNLTESSLKGPQPSSKLQSIGKQKKIPINIRRSLELRKGNRSPNVLVKSSAAKRKYTGKSSQSFPSIENAESKGWTLDRSKTM